jgi:hypothetical protein
MEEQQMIDYSITIGVIIFCGVAMVWLASK